MHNASTQSRKVNQTLPNPRNVAQARSREIKWGTWRGTLIQL